MLHISREFGPFGESPAVLAPPYLDITDCLYNGALPFTILSHLISFYSFSLIAYSLLPAMPHILTLAIGT